MGFWDAAKGFLGGGLFSSGFRSGAQDFLTGTPEKRENVSLLTKQQKPLLNQAVNAGLGPGAGGAFGDSADYYRNLLSDDSEDYNAFAAPQMRQFNEQIIPDIAEQFAGMGSGNLSSSGFRNAAVNAGSDLSERLGAIRANLRQQGAQGLQGIGQVGLGNFSQNMVTQQGSPGFLSQAAPAIGNGLAQYATGGLSNWAGGNNVGKNSSPYGNIQNNQNQVLSGSNSIYGR